MSDAKEHTQQGLIAESDRRSYEFQRMRDALVAIVMVCKDLKAQGTPLNHDAIEDVAKHGLGELSRST